ncbi:MAG: hypothetical protein HQL20_09085 [Candidatus Omnitrophica bacterium]|nr:hypothetical protein [Candidatus Omnitrophota bacterium]
MILRCTQKFLTELRLKKSDIKTQPSVNHPLDEWYAHIFTLYPRRKCAIFMHAKTKFCFYTYDRNRAQLNDIKGLFRKGLGRALFDEHYPAPVIKLFNSRLEDVQIGLAQDRRVQGFINQRVKEAQFTTDYDFDDPREADEVLVGLEARRSPMLSEKNPGYYAIKQMRDVLLTCPELNGIEIAPADTRHPDLEELYKARRDRAHAAGYL